MFYISLFGVALYTLPFMSYVHCPIYNEKLFTYCTSDLCYILCPMSYGKCCLHIALQSCTIFYALSLCHMVCVPIHITCVLFHTPFVLSYGHCHISFAWLSPHSNATQLIVCHLVRFFLFVLCPMCYISYVLCPVSYILCYLCAFLLFRYFSHIPFSYVQCIRLLSYCHCHHSFEWLSPYSNAIIFLKTKVCHLVPFSCLHIALQICALSYALCPIAYVMHPYMSYFIS